MRSLRSSLAGVASGLIFAALSFIAGAAEPAKSEIDRAFEAAGKVAQHGPGDVKLGTQATLKLPAGYAYVPTQESGKLLEAMGNRAGDSLLGTVWPDGQSQEQWFAVVRFVGEGYIKDDDARDWNADELLQLLKDGTERMNKERETRGITPIEVIGWVEKPHYDAAKHQLVWSVASRDKSGPDTAHQGINYNTYALGREGYISMNLVTDRNMIERYKTKATALLAGLDFDDGKRYADFNGSTDKVAAYGLAALIGGIAAKKLGLFAVLGVFFVKFWKVVAIGAVAAGGTLTKLFKKRKEKPTTVA